VNESTNPDTASRRFNLGDALILTGALALSLERFRESGWFRSFPQRSVSCWRALTELVDWLPWNIDPVYSRQHVTIVWTQHLIALTEYMTEELVVGTLCPLLLGLMVAQPLMRLRRPRPPLAQLIRQSGFVTCLICIVMVGGLVLILGNWWFSGVSLSLSLTRGILLILIWPLLGLPPWSAEKSWVDRLGRAVGWGWIVAMGAQAVIEYLRLD
jgi:hypothetical protein